MPSLTTAEAADLLGIKTRSVVKLIRRGLIVATKHGRDYMLDPTEIDRYARERQPAHRPSKPKKKE